MPTIEHLNIYIYTEGKKEEEGEEEKQD